MPGKRVEAPQPLYLPVRAANREPINSLCLCAFVCDPSHRPRTDRHKSLTFGIQ